MRAQNNRDELLASLYLIDQKTAFVNEQFMEKKSNKANRFQIINELIKVFYRLL